MFKWSNVKNTGRVSGTHHLSIDQAEAADAAQEVADGIADGQADFDATAGAPAEPTRLEYQAGFGEAYPFNDRRGPFEFEDPNMPGTVTVLGNEPLPAGFGAYESGEQFAWGNLKIHYVGSDQNMPTPTFHNG